MNYLFHHTHRLLAISCFTLFLLCAGRSYAQTPCDFSTGVISADCQHEGSLTINTDLTINPGVTVTFIDKGTNQANVTLRANLTATGATLSSVRSIRMEDGTQITGGTYQLRDRLVTVNNNTIRNATIDADVVCTGSMISLLSGNLRVINSRITDCKIRLSSVGGPTVQRIEVNDHSVITATSDAFDALEIQSGAMDINRSTDVRLSHGGELKTTGGGIYQRDYAKVTVNAGSKITIEANTSEARYQVQDFGNLRIRSGGRVNIAGDFLQNNPGQNFQTILEAGALMRIEGGLTFHNYGPGNGNITIMPGAGISVEGRVDGNQAARNPPHNGTPAIVIPFVCEDGTPRGTKCTAGDVPRTPILWLKADAGTNTTTDGTDITRWEDQSGRSKHAVTSTGGSTHGNDPSYRTNVLNFNPDVDFSRTDRENLQIAAPVFSTNRVEGAVVFMVLQSRNSTDRQVVLTRFPAVSDPDRNQFDLHLPVTSNSLKWTVGRHLVNVPAISDLSQLIREKRLWSFTAHEIFTSSGQRRMRRTVRVEGNEERVRNDLFSNLGHIASGQSFGLLVGGSNFGTADAFLDGSMCELIIYEVPDAASDTLQDHETERIETYLAIKYGLTLAHSYYAGSYDGTNAATATLYDISTAPGSTYNHNIAGIGRDDTQGLMQLKSKSSNSNPLLTVEAGAANVDNNDYLIWGSNNSNGENNTDIPAAYAARLNKVWFFKETGDVGSVTVRFDLTGIVSRNPDDYALLINRAESGFNTPATIHTTGRAIAGDEVIFTDVPISDGDYLTLASSASLVPPPPGMPGGVTGLQIWTRPEDIEPVSDTNPELLRWEDQSGEDNHLMSSSVSMRPVQQTTDPLNTHSYLRFTDDNLREVGSNPHGIAADMNYTLIAVMKSSADGTILRRYNRNVASEFITPSPRLAVESSRYRIIPSAGMTSANNTDAWNIVGNTLDTNMTLYFNGTQDVRNNNVSIDYPPNGSLFYRFFTNFTGDLAEMVYYDRSITDTERDKVETYLAIKYGITLSHDYQATNDEIVYDAGNGYGHDIAGIGREDTELLLQERSRSINPDAILVIDNAASLDDNDYLIWGNNNGVLTETTGNVPLSVTQRLGRVWKAEGRGDAGHVRLRFDTHGTSATSHLSAGKTAGDFALIVDEDATFNDGDETIISASGLIGGVVIFDAVALRPGQFFTLATDVEEIAHMPGDYEVNTSCPALSGSSYQTVRKSNDGLVFALNPNGQNLGATCWGLRIRESNNTPDDLLVASEDYFLDRNFYILPTNTPANPVAVRLYILRSEIDDIRARLMADGKNAGASVDDYVRNLLRITWHGGMDLNPVDGPAAVPQVITPTVTSFLND